MDQHGTACRIVWADAEVVDQVAPPEDVRVRRLQLYGGRVRPCLVLSLVGERPIIAVRQTVGVQADHFGRAGHHVYPIAVDRGRRADAQMLVAVQQSGRHFRPLRHGQSPEQLARGLVETLDQPAAGPFQPFVARQVHVVGPDVHAAAGNRRITVGGRTEFDNPLDVLRGFRIDPAFAFPRAAQNVSGKPVSADTIFRSACPPHCGQSAARPSTGKTNRTIRATKARRRRRREIRTMLMNDSLCRCLGWADGRIRIRQTSHIIIERRSILS